MRFLYLLLITILISSCASNKIRLVKNKDFQRAVVTVDTEIQEEITLAYSNKEASIETVSESVPNTTLDAIINENRIEPSKNQLTSKKKKKVDNKEIIRAARKAEWNAKKARNQSFIGGGIFLLSFIPFAGIAALVMLILALLNYSKANRSRYITPDGERYLLTARIVLIVMGVLLLLLLSLVLAFIFL